MKQGHGFCFFSALSLSWGADKLINLISMLTSLSVCCLCFSLTKRTRIVCRCLMFDQIIQIMNPHLMLIGHLVFLFQSYTGIWYLFGFCCSSSVKESNKLLLDILAKIISDCALILVCFIIQKKYFATKGTYVYIDKYVCTSVFVYTHTHMHFFHV